MLRLFLAAALSALAFCNPGWAQTYPDRPVTIVVGFGPGGTDTNARILAAQLTAQTGKAFVVLNKPGAGSAIAAEYVAKSKPDGYNLLMTSTATASLPAMQKKLQFDVVNDFIPISLISSSEASFLVAAPSLPVKDLKEFMAFAKDPKNSATYGSTGIGTGSHLRMALFAKANGLTMTHVPFKSPGDALLSLMSGETQVLFVTASQAVPMIKEKKVRALAYDYEARADFLPDVPTIAEAGAAPTNFDSGWSGLLAPANTPQPVIAWLEQEVRKAVQTPDVQEKLRNAGLIPVGSTSAEYAKAYKRAVETMGAAARAAGIEPQ